MRRLASTILTLWLLFFVPSLIVWVLVVRSGPSGIDRFASVWNWVVDRVAFPLVLSPLTDWSWLAMERGSAVSASAGFLILTTVWAAIFALPLALIAAWMRWMSPRIAGNAATSSYSYAEPGASSAGASPGHEVSSPLAAFYVITLPLALLWAGIKRLFGAATGSSTGFFRGAINLFVITFVLVTVLMALTFGLSGYWGRDNVIEFVYDTLWHGYLDTLHVPQLFQDRWFDAFVEVYGISNDARPTDWSQYMGRWYLHDEFRTLVLLTAARHGLAAVILFLIWRLLRRVFLVRSSHE